MIRTNLKRSLRECVEQNWSSPVHWEEAGSVMQALIGVRSVRRAVMLLERSVEGTLSTPVQPLAERELKQSWMGSKSETKVVQVVSSHLPDSKTCLSRTWTSPCTCQEGGETCWT